VISLKGLLSEHPLLWAVPVAVGVMIYFGYFSTKTKVEKVKPITPIQAVTAIPLKLRYFHGCPNRVLDLEKMYCLEDFGWLPKMTIGCRVTGVELTTDMVANIPYDITDFEVLQSCPGVTLVLWKPARMAFGVRNGKKWEAGTPFRETLPKIELMSRDPNQIIQLMCGESANATPAPGGSPRAGAAVTREDSPTPTGGPAARPR